MSLKCVHVLVNCDNMHGEKLKTVNAAVVINAIYCEYKMKRTLPKLLYITAGGVYEYH